MDADAAADTLARAAMSFGVPLDPARFAYYTNITGFVHGPALAHNLSALLPTSGPSDVDPSEIAFSPYTNPYLLTTDGTPPPAWAGEASTFMADFNATAAQERLGTWNWAGETEVAFRLLDKRPLYFPDDVDVHWEPAHAEKLSDISLMHVCGACLNNIHSS